VADYRQSDRPTVDRRAGAGYAARWTTEGTSGETTVTEAEWLACTDPQKMLEFLRDKMSDRKLRLFVCACCRRIWHQLTDKQSHRAVEIAERLADGQADPAEVTAARTEIEELLRRKEQEWVEEASLSEAAYLYGYMDQWPILLAQSAVGEDVTTERVNLAGSIANTDEAARAEWTAQAALLRDIFGNPFPPASITPAVLAWNDTAVVRLAQAAYDERQMPSGTLNNGRLAVLADALEEAGCTDADFLGHLRGTQQGSLRSAHAFVPTT
jgi:hypothetical protein